MSQIGPFTHGIVWTQIKPEGVVQDLHLREVVRTPRHARLFSHAAELRGEEKADDTCQSQQSQPEKTNGTSSFWC